jgi:hypothetical protein
MAGIRKVDGSRVSPTTTPSSTTTTSNTPTQAPAATSRPAPPPPQKALDARRHLDLRTQGPLGVTDEKRVADPVRGDVAAARQLEKHAAIQASHQGQAVALNELSPEFKLAKDLARDLAGKVWVDHAPPELKAIQEAIGPQVSALATQTVTRLLQDPVAAANLASLPAAFAAGGFKSAAQSAGRDVAGHFLQAAGVQAKNPEAIKAALTGIEQLAPRVGGTLGPKLAQTAANLGPRLLGESVQAATATATATKSTAHALPLVGNIVSVGSTLLAGANLIGQLAKTPRDVEKILKEGVNTLTQGLGVAFPWVALGGTLMDAAWSAKTSVSDQKKIAAGLPVTESANVAAALPLLSDSSDVLRAALVAAGKTETADKLAALSATTKTLAEREVREPGARLAALRKDQQEALTALSHEAHRDLSDVAASETGPRKQALLELAQGFGGLADATLATLRMDKRAGSPLLDEAARRDLQTKRNELAGKLVGQLGRAATAELLRRGEQVASSDP